MKKNTLEDIKAPVERKSIRNIPIPNRHRKTSQREDSVIEEKSSNQSHQTIDLKRNENSHSQNIDLRERVNHDEIREPKEPNFVKINSLEEDDRDGEDFSVENSFQKNPPKNRMNAPKKKRGKFLIFVILLLVAVVLVLNILKSASLEIYPRAESVENVNAQLVIIEDASQNPNNSNLIYKRISLENSAETIVEAEGEETVEEKASGTIRVFNEYSTEAQRLITNTRFETPDGKIYRINASLDVPGYTENNGQKTAGFIDVEVFADQAGESYNIGQTEFKIPGFKGQEQYDSFYAESRTPMAGGFSGVRKIISEEQIEISTRELQARITQNILEMAEDQISKDYLYFNNPENYSFGRADQISNSNNTVTLKMNGVAEFLVIEKQAFANSLANNLLPSFASSESNVTIENIDSAEITLTEDADNLYLNTVGNIKFIWQIDTDAFSEKLAGTKLNDLNKILEETPAITKIDNVVIRPIWNRTFPKKSDKIDINLIIN